MYEKHGMPVVGVNKVTEEQIVKYCSLKVEHMHDNVYHVSDMIEKPAKDKIFSLFSILGRVLLTPDIFDILDHTAPGAGGEIQLTDAMRELAVTKGMTACDFEGKRYDIGSKFGFLQANIDLGLKHPETADALRAYIKELAGNL